MNQITNSNQPPYRWQQTAWDQVMQWQSNDQLPHAIAINGPQGLGHQALAWHIAKRLLCHNGVACGTCQSCYWWDAGTHPDWLTVSHGDQVGSIKIDAIRSMLNHVQQTPHTACRRIVLVHPAEAMTLSAANALLKTLEEPASHVLFLLITYQPQYTPITIMSRCQVLTLTVPALHETQQWLQQQGVTHVEALARFSGGLPLLAYSMDEQVLARHADIAHQLKLLASNQITPESLLSPYHELSMVQWMDHLQKIVEDSIRLGLGITTTLYWPEATEHLQWFYCERTTEELLTIRDRLNAMTATIHQNTSLNYEATVTYLLLTSIGSQLNLRA